MRNCLLILLLLWAAPAMGAVFGSTEFARNRPGGFPKWAAMTQRDQAPVAGPEPGPHLPDASACQPGSRIGCPADRLAQFVESQRRAPRDVQLEAVNRYFNAQAYITDPVNWGVPDYWAALREFLARDGDCEDYAIAKYETLKQLGWRIEDMRIVIVQDENLGVPHAILAATSGRATYILDNQIQQVLPDTAIVHYRPFYSLNDQGFWVHAARIK